MAMRQNAYKHRNQAADAIIRSCSKRYRNMNTEEDLRIIEEFNARQENAIQDVQDRYNGYCTSIAYRILQNRQDAEECVNDTWMRAWNTIPPQKPESLKTYLGCITRNIAIGLYRTGSAAKRAGNRMSVALEELGDAITVSEDNVAEAVSSKALTDALNEFLDGLEDEKRNVFIQRYFYLDSIAEIADQNGISSSNVKVILFRLRMKLKEKLKKEELL